MSIMLPKIEPGFTFTDNVLTLNFDNAIHAEKLSDGVYIPKGVFGYGLDGIVDGWTIKPKQNSNGEYVKDANGHTLIDINKDVVTCIYTLSRRKVTNRSSVGTYATSNTTKTVEDIIDEFNCAMDAYKALGTNVPTGLPTTSYVMQQGDLFQFRENAKPWIPAKNADNQTWPCAMDDMNRYEAEPIVALFYIVDIAYDDPDMATYMTKLSLKCVWSTLADYVVGQTYTATKS